MPERVAPYVPQPTTGTKESKGSYLSELLLVGESRLLTGRHKWGQLYSMAIVLLSNAKGRRWRVTQCHQASLYLR